MQLIATSWSPEYTKLLGELVASLKRNEHHYASVRGILLITPWSRVLPRKLIGSQLVKKFPAFYGTQMFIDAFASARYLDLS